PFDVQLRDETGSSLSNPAQAFTLTLRYGSIPPVQALKQSLNLHYWDGRRWLPEVESSNAVTDTTVIARVPRRIAWRLAAESNVVQSKLFLPKLVGSSPGITLVGFEATQGIQTLTNTIPLVAGRPTTLR